VRVRAILKPETWRDLFLLSEDANSRGWAAPGVFATAVGPEYEVGAKDTLFYLGKAGGPLIGKVGISNDQQVAATAAVAWMVERRNPSAFWRFADLLGQGRTRIAWSNVAKIDTRTPRPPSEIEWRQIQEACMRALKEELEVLKPARTVFAISDYHRTEVVALLRRLGFSPHVPAKHLSQTEVFVNNKGQLAVITRHPQGWRSDERDSVADFVRSWRCH